MRINRILTKYVCIAERKYLQSDNSLPVCGVGNCASRITWIRKCVAPCILQKIGTINCLKTPVAGKGSESNQVRNSSCPTHLYWFMWMIPYVFLKYVSCWHDRNAGWIEVSQPMSFFRIALNSVTHNFLDLSYRAIFYRFWQWRSS